MSRRRERARKTSVIEFPWHRSSWRDDRLRAFETYPPHLTDMLLKLPEPARTELRNVIDATLIPLAQIRENRYRIPPGPPGEPPPTQPDAIYTRSDFDNIISELQALVTLLEEEPKS